MPGEFWWQKLGPWELTAPLELRQQLSRGFEDLCFGCRHLTAPNCHSRFLSPFVDLAPSVSSQSRPPHKVKH